MSRGAFEKEMDLLAIGEGGAIREKIAIGINGVRIGVALHVLKIDRAIAIAIIGWAESQAAIEVVEFPVVGQGIGVGVGEGSEGAGVVPGGFSAHKGIGHARDFAADQIDLP